MRPARVFLCKTRSSCDGCRHGLLFIKNSPSSLNRIWASSATVNSGHSAEVSSLYLFHILATVLLLRSGRPQTQIDRATRKMDGDGLIPSDRTQTTNYFHAVLDDSGPVVILNSAQFVWQTFGCLCCPPFVFTKRKVHLA